MSDKRELGIPKYLHPLLIISLTSAEPRPERDAMWRTGGGLLACPSTCFRCPESRSAFTEGVVRSNRHGIGSLQHRMQCFVRRSVSIYSHRSGAGGPSFFGLDLVVWPWEQDRRADAPTHGT